MRRLDEILYFHNHKNMETFQAVTLLAALAQETRLAIFRLLVECGQDGRAAGAIGEELGLAPATLSFHLKELAHAGLIHGRQDGRFIYYAADFDTMSGLLDYLMRNCCARDDARPRRSPQCC